MTSRYAILAAAVVLAGATVIGDTMAAAAPPACPNTGLRTAPVVLKTAKGRYRYDLDIAATPAQQQCGLMYRTDMKRSAGMWFPFDEPRSATFWMENTPLALDIVFVGPDKRVLSVASNAKPMSRMIIDSKGIAASVIELNAGEAARIGLKAGDKVEL